MGFAPRTVRSGWERGWQLAWVRQAPLVTLGGWEEGPQGGLRWHWCVLVQPLQERHPGK